MLDRQKLLAYISTAASRVKTTDNPAVHPPYASMIMNAIRDLGDKEGSSRQAILKYVVLNNEVDATEAAGHVRNTLKNRGGKNVFLSVNLACRLKIFCQNA